jgi:hypothetical protein
MGARPLSQVGALAGLTQNKRGPSRLKWVVGGSHSIPGPVQERVAGEAIVFGRLGGAPWDVWRRPRTRARALVLRTGPQALRPGPSGFGR